MSAIPPTLALPTAAVPRTAPQRLAEREADLLSRLRRNPWNARATTRARTAGTLPMTRSDFWSSHRSAGAGSTRMRSNVVLAADSPDLLTRFPLRWCRPPAYAPSEGCSQPRSVRPAPGQGERGWASVSRPDPASLRPGLDRARRRRTVEVVGVADHTAVAIAPAFARRVEVANVEGHAVVCRCRCTSRTPERSSSRRARGTRRWSGRCRCRRSSRRRRTPHRYAARCTDGAGHPIPRRPRPGRRNSRLP